PSVTEAAEHAEEPGVALVDGAQGAARDRFGTDRRRDVERAADVDAEEAALRDAHDVERMTVEQDRPADDRGVAMKLRLPEGVAEHDARRGAALSIVSGSDQSACRGTNAKRVEEVAADPEAASDARLAARRQVEVPRPPCEQL